MLDLSLESRLERLALRYGCTVEELVAQFESAAPDGTDPLQGISEAELCALDEAGISLEGPVADPTGPPRA